MDGSDKMKIEKHLSDPCECNNRVFLREFFGWEYPLKCPNKPLLRSLYNKMLEKERECDSGLI